MRQRDVAALDAKYTKGFQLMLKLKMIYALMMLPLVVVGLSKQSVSQCVQTTTASGVDNAASRLADTAERDYFTLREADHYAKTTGRNPEAY